MIALRELQTRDDDGSELLSVNNKNIVHILIYIATKNCQPQQKDAVQTAACLTLEKF